MTMHARFPSPYDLKAPTGAEGWQQLYPYYLLFQDKLRDKEEGKFWFCDSQHWPSPFKPFDAVTVEFAVKCLGQYNTRHYMVPPANGVDYRIHNGYVYMSPVAVAPDLIPGRVPQFLQRAGHYFQNWDSLLANWHKKVRANIADLEALKFEKLPDVVPLEWITGGIGLDNTYALMENYDRAIQLLYKAWQYHFEFLNLGYAAYLDFFGFVKEQFPTIPDQAIAKMVQGVDVDLFRPDDELKKLAKLAVKLGIPDALKAEPSTKRSRPSPNIRAAPNGSRPGRRRRIPGSISRPATASIPPINTGSSTSTFRSASSAITSLDLRRAKPSTARPRKSPRSATGSLPNMPTCSRATPAPPSRASSGLHGRCFHTWRTIISTSSIGR